MCKHLNFEKFEDAGFKYDNSSLKFRPKNIQVRCFWSQFKSFLVLQVTLQFCKFESVDFTYGNSFFKLLPKITQITFFNSYTYFFLFFMKLWISKISKVYLTKVHSRYTQIRHFSPKSEGFYICIKLLGLKNLRVLILNMTTFFSNSCLKIPE